MKANVHVLWYFGASLGAPASQVQQKELRCVSAVWNQDSVDERHESAKAVARLPRRHRVRQLCAIVQNILIKVQHGPLCFPVEKQLQPGRSLPTWSSLRLPGCCTCPELPLRISSRAYSSRKDASVKATRMSHPSSRPWSCRSCASQPATQSSSED